MEDVDIDIEKLNRINFRSCLEALSRPGTPYPVEPLWGSPLMAMASLLLYSEVSYHYHGEQDFQLVSPLTGAREQEVERAQYIFSDMVDMDLVQRANVGRADSPEEGSTLLFQCFNLDAGIQVFLSGPGIDDTRTGFLPMDSQTLTCLKKKNSEFPLGVDIFLVDQTNRIIGLPRTVNIEVV